MNFFLYLAIAGLAMEVNGRAETVEVTIDPGTAIGNRFMGLGVQWDRFDAYPLSPLNWKLTTNRMDYCAPGYLRVMWGAFSYCQGFDATGQPRYTWQDKDPARRKDVEVLTAILNFAQARNIPVIFGEWSPPMGLISGQLDPRWPRMVADSVAYLRNERGYTCIRFYNLINEPNGDWSHNKDYQTWLQSVRNLRHELDARGLGDTVHIIGPDTFGSSRWQEPLQWLEKAETNCLVHLRWTTRPIDTRLYVYRYFAMDRPVEADGYPKPEKVWLHANLQASHTLAMPTRGVIILTTRPPR